MDFIDGDGAGCAAECETNAPSAGDTYQKQSQGNASVTEPTTGMAPRQSGLRPQAPNDAHSGGTTAFQFDIPEGPKRKSRLRSGMDRSVRTCRLVRDRARRAGRTLT